jgi:hypothetical protein
VKIKCFEESAKNFIQPINSFCLLFARKSNLY